ncbi:rRNA maturation RNase YbeY [Nitrincola iocasae]|jgi:probable rRNA maturation factor|uniref:Endoribonuclease YbeY n=1 Tax=Nitrincola iocasae TaxID=2614693 RepID=A0A5J6LA89_9GAMM|nr:rRNA maturation RNase YbeY [Nitrincola iocasae]QEW05443.1 rRNA maturation RNase YbeY [Nitrincola iocasae]
MPFDVDIQIAVEDQVLPDEAAFQRWVNTALSGRLEQAEVCIRIVSPEESRELNLTWRGQDKPTNVLSFPFEAPPGIETHLIGDLAICAKVVAAEAEEQQKQLAAHWAHMVIHGVLHLIGFDHINDDDAEAMEALEVSLLAQLDISNPYLSA